MSMKSVEIKTDVLVIGGGMSGIFAAVKAKEAGAEVVLVDKNHVGRSGATIWSNIFTAFNADWGHDRKTWEGYYNLQAEGVNNRLMTGIVLDEAYERYKDLEAWGAFFPKLDNGMNIPCGLPGVPVAGFVMQKGMQFMPALRRHALGCGVRIIDHVMVTDLAKNGGPVSGAVGFHAHDGTFYEFRAGAVIMCTGPSGFKAIKHMATANLTGDAEAMAYRAGAEISGKEFAFSGAAGFIDGMDEKGRVDIRGKAVNDACEKDMVWAGYLPQIGAYDWFVDAQGFPLDRNNAAMAIHQGRGPVLLDMDAVPESHKEWSDLDIKANGDQRRLERMGLEGMLEGLWSGTFRPEMNVGSAHGGGAGIAQTGLDCATSLPGLFAAGDCLNSRAVGAKYPFVGNGQANASVTGARAGRAAAAYAKSRGSETHSPSEAAELRSRLYEPIERDGGFSPRWVAGQLQNIVFPYYYSIVKHGDRLKAALAIISFLSAHMSPRLRAVDAHGLRLAHETRNMLLNAEMIVRASLFRQESRGEHYREDFPRRDDEEWLAWIRIKDSGGMMELTKETIPAELRPDLSEPYEERYNNRFCGE